MKRMLASTGDGLLKSSAVASSAAPPASDSRLACCAACTCACGSESVLGMLLPVGK